MKYPKYDYNIVLMIVTLKCVVLALPECGTKQFRCGNGSAGTIALCVRKLEEDVRKDYCHTEELEEVYNIGSDCTPTSCSGVVRNYCEENNPCSNGGECVPTVGYYFCKCPGGFRGTHCTENGDRIAKGVYFAYDPVQTTGRRSSIVFVNNPGPDIRIKFTAESSGEVTTITKNEMSITDGGGVELCKKISIEITHLCTFLQLSGKSLYYATLFYYIPYNKEEPVISDYKPKAGEYVPGFKVNNIKLEMFNELEPDIEEFSHTFKQTTVYKTRNDCPSQVTLVDCGETSESPLSLARKSTITVKSVFEENEDCLYAEKVYIWEVFKYKDTWMKASPEPILSEKGDKNELELFTIQPFQLEIELYLVKLTVELINKQKSIVYFNVCYIEIKGVPLSAEIKGGDKRTVFVNSNNLVLDASNSYDPNEPLDRQDHLAFHWTCFSHSTISCTTSSQGTSMCVIDQGLSLGEVYEFQLELTTKDGLSSPEKVSQIITTSENEQVDLELVCLKNCGVEDFKTNPRDVVYMEVKVISDVVVSEFVWLYSANGGKEDDVSSIRKNEHNSHVLVVKENSLMPGYKYTFTVKLTGTVKTLEGSASLSILVNNPPVAGSCLISPTTGTKVKTEFDITCSNFTDDNEIPQLRYEYYQKASDEPEPGTLFGYSISGEMKKIILTETLVMIRASDIYGAYSGWVSVQVQQLNDWSPQIEDVKELLAEASAKAMAGDGVGAACLAGVIVDVMQSIEDKRSVFKDILEVLNIQTLTDFSDVRLLASVLRKVVRKGVPQIENGMKSKSIKSLGTLMASVGVQLYQELAKLDPIKPVIDSEDVEKIALSLAECTDALVASKDETLFQSSEASLDVFKSHDEYKKGTSGMIKALYYTGYGIINNLLPQEKERIIISQDTLFWLKLESPNVLANMSGIPENSTTRVKISENLGKHLEGISKYVGIEVITLRNNPFWWDATDRQIASEITSLRVWEKNPQRMKSVSRIPVAVDIYLQLKDMKYETLTGIVTQPSPLDSDDVKDASVCVHTLEAPKENSNGRIFIEVENFDDVDEFIVLMTVNLRPDYDLMISNATSVTVNSSYLHLTYENLTENTLHFVGILPGPRVPPNKTASYSIRIFSIQCKVRQESVWASPACVVGEGTTSNVVHCQCSHMSFFGSSIFVAPNTVHPIKDLYLFTTLNDNPLVFCLILSLLVVYCLLLIWTLLKDRKNRQKTKIIVLDDNYPGDSCPYLIVVYTAFNIGSATESKVGLRLIGEDNTTFSRAHILQCQYRKVLRRNADDWFLLFTPEHLGTIEAIHLWHNHSGSHPDWFCKRIKVYDMEKSVEYNFLVQQWMSAEPGEYVEVVVKVAPPSEIYNWKNCIIHNIIYHLRENHLWASIFLSHPRATVTKSQRLTITFCIIMVTFLTGIMFYGVAKQDRVEDEHKYEIKAREIVIAVISSIISAITVSFVVLSFKRSQVIVRTKLNVEGSKASLSSLHSAYKENRTEAPTKKGFAMQYISKFLRGVVRGKPLMPILVGKETSDSVIRRRRWATIGWIASQIIIWTSAFFVILYGLKLGKVISELWATSAVMCFLNGILFTAPVKILFFSAILALYGEMYNVTNFECVIESATRKELEGDLNVLEELMELRSQPIYHPLSLNQLRNFRQKSLQRKQAYQRFELVVTIFFYFVLFNVTGDLWEIRNFYVNKHVSQVLTDDKGSFPIGLRNVITVAKLTDFLIAKLLPSLYKENWYNKNKLTSLQESLPEMGWLSDTVHRLIGIPQWRQVRIKTKSCSFSAMFNVSEARCLPTLNLDTEDTGDYGFNWGPISEFINKPLRVPFSYRKGLAEHPIVLGDSGALYRSGGYVVRLEDTQKKCNAIVSDLMDNGWWDIRMRAFIIELTLVNPNTQSHTMVTIAIEHLPSGIFTNRITVTTVHISLNYTFPVLFIVLMVYFNFRLFLIVNRRGFSYALTHFWSCYEFLFVWICNITVGFEVVKIIGIGTAVSVFVQSGSSDFFHFSNIVLYEKVSLWLWCLTLCIAPMRIFKFKFFRTTCRTAYYTFRKCWSLLAAVSFVICVLTVSQLFVLKFAFCPESRPLDVETRFNKMHTNYFDYGTYSFRFRVVSMFLAVTSTVANIILQVIIIYHYKIMSDY